MESVVKELLLDELRRVENMEKAFEKQISKYPKGSIQIKKINGKQYPYLCYREGGKVVSKYLKVSPIELEIVKKRIQERKQREMSLKRIRKDKKVLSKAVKIK
jgi:hypothetical protein